MSKISHFIFHGSLNDFLSHSQHGKLTKYEFFGTPTIKDAIEAQGVPHPEIGEIHVNEMKVDFDHRLLPDDKVEVYPLLITMTDNTPIQFVVDSHLGKLAKDLRVLGFDCLYEKNYTEEKIAIIAQDRIVLTRNIGLLKNKLVSQGYWLRSQKPEDQIHEVILHFNLKEKIEPFSRCRVCNGLIKKVPKQFIEEQLPEMIRIQFQDFYQCDDCGQVYWKGSHYEKMVKLVERVKNLE